MAPLDLLKTVLGKLRQFQLVSGLKHTLQLHPPQSVRIRAARTPLLLAPRTCPRSTAGTITASLQEGIAVRLKTRTDLRLRM